MMQHTSLTPRFVAYIRVSTAEQGLSGLGIEAQRAAITAAVGSDFDEYVEVESGRKNSRPVLAAALAAAKSTGATLVVAKLDRLGRNAAFLHALADSGLSILTADRGRLGTLELGIYATLAQHEAETISARTKAALAAKKARGEKLGNPNPRKGTGATAAAVAARKSNAANDPSNRRAAAFIVALRRANPALSLRMIASELNAAGFRTRMGKEFTATQVSRLIDHTVNTSITA